MPLGDCWRHPALTTGDATTGLVPLHKLSQWLAYSLIEPLQAAGIEVTDIDGLTGLAEYRNGGLLIDTGVLQLRDRGKPRPSTTSPRPSWSNGARSPWRCSTGWRRWCGARLGKDAASFPLAKVLQGGTWAAGREIARARRADGSPPIKVVSDGTVF